MVIVLQVSSRVLSVARCSSRFPFWNITQSKEFVAQEMRGPGEPRYIHSREPDVEPLTRTLTP